MSYHNGQLAVAAGAHQAIYALYYLHQGRQVESCPEGFYPEWMDCLPCPPGCEVCSSESACTGCSEGLLRQGLSCVAECGSPLFRNYQTRSCDPCPHLYRADDQSCHLACPALSYQTSGSQCASCQPPCQQCSGANACVTCEQGLLLLGQQCLGLCPTGYFDQASECRGCPLNCDICNKDGCLACSAGHFLEASLCMDTCMQCVIKVTVRGFQSAYRNKEIIFSWNWQSHSQPVFYCNSSTFEKLPSARQLIIRWSCEKSSHIFANVRLKVAAGPRNV